MKKRRIRGINIEKVGEHKKNEDEKNERNKM
jgi:hypothetical protein